MATRAEITALIGEIKALATNAMYFGGGRDRILEVLGFETVKQARGWRWRCAPDFTWHVKPRPLHSMDEAMYVAEKAGMALHRVEPMATPGFYAWATWAGMHAPIRGEGPTLQIAFTVAMLALKRDAIRES